LISAALEILSNQEMRMRVKKTVTEAVVQSNQNNSKKSPGPKDTSRTKYAAVKHGFLGSKIQFENEDQEQEFGALVAELTKNRRPIGPEERIEIEIMAFELFQMRELFASEFARISKRDERSTTVLEAIGSSDIEGKSVLRTC
jgi:hypothetical protein